ncbi:hypothetical protein [Spiroplasma eriocheiris]|uniref:Uncharacterized protein n=1 Tax=Spiroplasma eriocheiris TaxID=315358 RepID=A0A0H3XIT0_9MOLU|nr:hypothetical protein [Spiroplasma eriocheiris]AHF57959.1 hypothetical protein SPE_0839 [Spiroplasma eriocheiris CCTCC M 207170]AKM54400.1 hypothetical protein SERIO_v1c08400 [Spiroplasma eriocheiris]
MGISILKTIIAAGVLTISPVAITTSMVMTNDNKAGSPRDAMFETIKKSSKVTATTTQWTYDNHKFYSESDLNNYIYIHNKVETIQTTSNPGKIITDYQYHLLDPNQIYDTDINNYQLVYQDAFGNAALSKERALNSYTNNGLVKEKYGYDGTHWYDSPQEAKDGFIYKGGLRKSLYYYVSGRYYNVFNKQDQTDLLKVLTDGYHLKPSDFTNGVSLYGTEQSFRNVVQDNFRNVWGAPESHNKINYKNYMNFSNTHKIYLSPGGGDLMKVKNNKTGDYMEVGHGDSVVIDDIDDQWTIADFTESKRNWAQSKQCDDWSCSVGKYYYTKNFHSANRSYTLTYLPASSGSAWRATNFSFGNISSSETFDADVLLYDKPLTNPSKHSIWRVHLNHQVNNYVEIPTEYILEAYDTWFNYFYDNDFLKLDKVASNGTRYNDYGVYADTLYDVNGQHGYKYSVTDSINYYNNYLKPQILAQPVIDKNGNKLYKLRDDFYATQQEVNDYLFLEGIVDTRLMYTFLDVQDISSQDGLSLAPTQAEAQEKLFQLQAGVLLKEFFAYDVYGNYVLSGDSGEEAIRKLQQAITLTGKYVHQKEIASWQNRSHSYDSIISDGHYIVYRVYSSQRAQAGLTPYLYFDNYNYALNAIKAGINGQIMIDTTTVNIYLYIYIDKNNHQHSYSYINDEEINNIIDEIMKLNNN